MAEGLANLVQRLELAVSKLESISSPAGNAGDSAGGAVSVYVEAFDAIVKGPVADYLCLSQKIGCDVQKQAKMIEDAFNAQRQFLVTASTSKKPSETVLQQLLKPVCDLVTKVQEFRESHRSSSYFNHLTAVSEAVPALGWVTLEPKPGPFVKEMCDAAMFYTNKVLKDYKDKDKTHVDWVKAYLAIWTNLQNYIKQHHTTGLIWSKTGPVATASAGGSAPPPPPGPPPPPMEMSMPSSDSHADTGDRSALFAAINKGGDITKGLKHVSDDKKTHKNPQLRGQGGPLHTGPKPYSSPSTKPAASTIPCAKAPVLQLEGKKWIVENQNNQNLKIEDTEMKQVVYAYNCNGSTLTVKGKINAITIDTCKKTGLVFDNVVGIVEVINSQSVKVQVLGKVPTISVNKTDGFQLYLSNDSLTCEIISAKSSEMNILVPNKDGEFGEHPVPEQFKTVWSGDKLVTTVTEIAG
ncbi:adenylyl cyclase-associated protein 1 [Pholidichthys leucotaenia]